LATLLVILIFWVLLKVFKLFKPSKSVKWSVRIIYLRKINITKALISF
jgi:hypothetical protein